MIDLVILFKSYLGEDVVCNIINAMVEESKYCSDVMKKHFNKELVMAMLKIFRTLLIVGFVIMFMSVMVMLKEMLKDDCHITGRDSARRDCKIKVKFNNKISIAFRNLKKLCFTKL